MKAALNTLEGTAGQQTEPDIILRIPRWGWIFIEAKLASPTSTYKGRKEKLETWKARYAKTDLFNDEAIATARPETFPEQLLRNVAVARAVAGGEQIAVVALVREVYEPKARGWAGNYIADTDIVTQTATWEQLYAVTDGHKPLAALRSYLADKSVNLSRAFSL